MQAGDAQKVAPLGQPEPACSQRQQQAQCSQKPGATRALEDIGQQAGQVEKKAQQARTQGDNGQKEAAGQKKRIELVQAEVARPGLACVAPGVARNHRATRAEIHRHQAADADQCQPARPDAGDPEVELRAVIDGCWGG